MYYSMNNKHYSKISVNPILLHFHFPIHILKKNSYRCAFPLCSSEKCKLYRIKYLPVHLHFYKETMSKCLFNRFSFCYNLLWF